MERDMLYFLFQQCNCHVYLQMNIILQLLHYVQSNDATILLPKSNINHEAQNQLQKHRDAITATK
jgi:hypothetical protein